MHAIKKFLDTLRIAYKLIMARTFGKYRHSVYADGISYAIYDRGGETWIIPTEPVEHDVYGSPL